MKLFNIHAPIRFRSSAPKTPSHQRGTLSSGFRCEKDLTRRPRSSLSRDETYRCEFDLGYSARVVFQTEICHAAKTPETCKLIYIYIDIYRLHIDTSMTHQLHRHHEFDYSRYQQKLRSCNLASNTKEAQGERVQGLRRGGKRMTRNSEMTKKDGTRNGVYFSNLASSRI